MNNPRRSRWNRSSRHDYTRREILRGALSAGVGLPLGAGLLAGCREEFGSSDDDNDRLTSIEPNRRRRNGVGIRGHNPGRSSEGFTLFTPLNNNGEVYLIDMDGEAVHTWNTGYPPGLYGYLTDEGTLFYNAQTEFDDSRFLGQQPFRGGLALEMDWDGNILWEIEHPDHHHDGIKLSNGNIMLLCLGPIPDELAAQVQGGRPDSEHEGTMYADYLVEMTTEGEVVWEWRCWDHLDPEEEVIVAEQDGRAEWTHGNAVAELDDGNLIVSFRSTCSVVIVDRESGEITWRLGPPDIVHQHAPEELENGNILIFDNGTHRPDHHLPYSRVVEVDPATDEIVWTYQEPNIVDFFSPLISNAQRLPNGNTLICEGNFGRFFEVTEDGQTVWEYINPHFHDSLNTPEGTDSNEVFRCYRYTEEQVDVARRTV